jgi:hypothetical protein
VPLYVIGPQRQISLVCWFHRESCHSSFSPGSTSCASQSTRSGHRSHAWHPCRLISFSRWLFFRAAQIFVRSYSCPPSAAGSGEPALFLKLIILPTQLDCQRFYFVRCFLPSTSLIQSPARDFLLSFFCLSVAIARRARCACVKISAARARLGFRSGLVCVPLVSTASTCAAVQSVPCPSLPPFSSKEHAVSSRVHRSLIRFCRQHSSSTGRRSAPVATKIFVFCTGAADPFSCSYFSRQAVFLRFRFGSLLLIH